ncbi:hypothetical protein MNBD_GAMMA11-2518 [hydrothermal vent metagenome]|uniref:Uncharacterized protein n=1 Tax=hydrothermal vent metagenome TaxID=652676 RepID=A0A3B0X6T4_9ZZZZ
MKMKMKRVIAFMSGRISRLLLIGVFAGVLSGSLNAQTVAQDVLDDIVITRSGFTGVVKIKFRVPLRYISHNPKKIGKEIRIRVGVVANNNARRNPNINNRGFNSGSENEFRPNLRESLTPRYEFSFGLDEVSYETVLGENYLTLYFKDNVSFEIVQDPSYRSISVVLHDVSKQG